MYTKPLSQCELTQKRIDRIEQKLGLSPIQAAPPLTGRKTCTPRLALHITKPGGLFVDVISLEATEDFANLKSWDAQITVKESNACIKATIGLSDGLLFHSAAVWGESERQIDVFGQLEVGDAIALQFKEFSAQGSICKLDATRNEIAVKGNFNVPTPDDGSRSYHKWHPFRPGVDSLLDTSNGNRAMDYEIEKGLLGGTRIRIKESFEGLRPGLMDMSVRDPEGNRRGVSFVAEELHVTEASAEVLLRPLIEMKGDS